MRLRRTLLALALVFSSILAAAPVAQSYWQSRSQVSVGAAAYVGPGDVVSGATTWWGFRAYSAARAGNPAINIVRASDSATTDINTLANGNLDTATAATFCNATTCKIITFYDQTGNTNCAGPLACNLTQATDARRPNLIFNCQGSFPCARYLRATNQFNTSPLHSTPLTQPYTISAIGKRTGSTTLLHAACCGTDIFFGWSNAVNTANMSGGVNLTAAAADSVFHSLTGVFNSTSSDMNVDGTATVGDGGTNNFSASVAYNMGAQASGTSALTGDLLEMGVWPSAFSGANSTAISANGHSYYGF